jgi:GT2 family glycosyltransferase
LEIILVDNNSTDNSAGEAERLFPELRIIRNLKNLGFAEGNNVGIRSSSGDLILLANNDIVLEPNTISSLTDSLRDGTGIVGGLIYYSNGGKIWAYGGRFDPATGMHWHLLQGMSRHSSVPRRLEVDYVPGALLLVRRSILDQAGLLDPYFFLYGDDIDLALKAKRLGYSVIVTSSARANHMVSQSVKKLEKRHELLGYYMMNRNMFYLYFVQLPIPLALTSTVFQVAFLIFEIFIFRRQNSYIRMKMTALAHALEDFDKAWQARNRVKKIGQIRVRFGFRDLLHTARSRANSRTYYW